MAASLLPPNATDKERALEDATSRIGDVPVEITRLWDPDTCPAELLPWLAWAMSVDTWSAYWPEAAKRAAVRNSFALHRRKGTAWAVRTVVEGFGAHLALKEWWQSEPPGDPYTFSVVLSADGLVPEEQSAQYVADIIDQINRTKPLRAWFTFTQALRATGGLGFVGRARAAAYRRICGGSVVAPPDLPTLVVAIRVTADGQSRATTDGALRMIEEIE